MSTKKFCDNCEKEIKQGDFGLPQKQIINGSLNVSFVSKTGKTYHTTITVHETHTTPVPFPPQAAFSPWVPGITEDMPDFCSNCLITIFTNIFKGIQWKEVSPTTTEPIVSNGNDVPF